MGSGGSSLKYSGHPLATRQHSKVIVAFNKGVRYQGESTNFNSPFPTSADTPYKGESLTNS
jgi:hypothetical protein